MSKNLYKLVTIEPRSYWQAYGPIQAELFVPTSWALLVRILDLSEALVIVPCHCARSRLPSMLQAYVHAVEVRFLLELSLLELLLPSWCSGSRSLCAAVFSVLVFCHVRACDMHTICFLPELLVAWCWACATKQPCVSFTAYAHYVPCGQTDTWSDELPLNDQMWGSLTLTPNNSMHTLLTILHNIIMVEPPINGPIGGRILVLCWEVVPVLEVLASHTPQLRGCKVVVRGVVYKKLNQRPYADILNGQKSTERRI